MSLKSTVTTILAASVIALGLGGSAVAQSTTGNVSVEITPGELVYSITGADLGKVLYAETDTSSTGSLQLAVNGNGNLKGWTLSVQATQDFVYSGDSATKNDIPANHLSLTQSQAPTYSKGQAIDTTHGPVATAKSGTLGSAIPVMTSEAGYGSGAYNQSLDVSLAIPAYSQVGTYTGVVTVTASSAPGGN